MFSWICLGLLEPGAVAAACSMVWIKTFTAVFSSSLHCSLEEIRHLIKGDHFQIVIQIGMMSLFPTLSKQWWPGWQWSQKHKLPT